MSVLILSPSQLALGKAELFGILNGAAAVGDSVDVDVLTDILTIAKSRSWTLGIDDLKTMTRLASVAGNGVSPGASLYLYSGVIGNTSGGDLIASIANGRSDILTIRKTDAFRFLESIEFNSAFEEACDATGIPEAARADLINGKMGINSVYAPGFWDIPSESIARSAVGDVRTITLFASFDRILAIGDRFIYKSKHAFT